MPDPAAPNPHPGRSRDPNFLAVVAISGVILILFFVAAWVLVMHSGKHLLPNDHPNPQPHSYLQMPGPGTGVRAA